VQLSADIDPATVEVSDFLVKGSPPTSVFVPNLPAVSGVSNAAAIYSLRSIYLTVPALAVDERPEVKIVSSISDKAGNSITSKDITDVKDGLQPVLTVSVSGGQIVDGKRTISTNNPSLEKVIVDITTNETLSSPPTVRFTDTEPIPTSTSTINALGTAAFTTNLVTSNLYRVEIKAASLSSDKDNFLIVHATDLAGNRRNTTTGSDLGLIKVTVDNSVKGVTDPRDATATVTPLFDPDNRSGETPTEVEETTVFIKATYGEKVSLVSASFDGTSVIRSVLGDSDGKVWQYVAKDLAIDSIHNFAIVAKDSIGNASASATTRFKVVEPAGTKINMFTGWNLISIPDVVKDPAVGSVLKGLDVDLIMTYDTEKGWLTAAWDKASGKYVGSLTTIDPGKGYFAHTNSPVLLKVVTATKAPTDLPATIPVKKGWNLIAASTAAKGVTTFAIAPYLYGTRWTALYSFSPDPAVGYQVARPSSGSLGAVTAVATSAKWTPAGLIQVGRGYWLYAEADGVITP